MGEEGGDGEDGDEGEDGVFLEEVFEDVEPDSEEGEEAEDAGVDCYLDEPVFGEEFFAEFERAGAYVGEAVAEGIF